MGEQQLEALVAPVVKESAIVIKTEYCDGSVCIVRTNMGPDVARRVASFELERQDVHLSVALDRPWSRLDVIRALNRARKEKRRLTPMERRSVTDYVFTLVVAKKPTLPDMTDAVVDLPRNARVAAQMATRRKFRVKSLLEFLRDEIEAEKEGRAMGKDSTDDVKVEEVLRES
jgi:hypothetical protein